MTRSRVDVEKTCRVDSRYREKSIISEFHKIATRKDQGEPPCVPHARAALSWSLLSMSYVALELCVAGSGLARLRYKIFLSLLRKEFSDMDDFFDHSQARQEHTRLYSPSTEASQLLGVICLAAGLTLSY